MYVDAFRQLIGIGGVVDHPDFGRDRQRDTEGIETWPDIRRRRGDTDRDSHANKASRDAADCDATTKASRVAAARPLSIDDAANSTP